MWRVKLRKASACSLPALTMPLAKQENSGAYLASIVTWGSLTSPRRIRLSPLVRRKSSALPENADTSLNSALRVSSRSSSVPSVVIWSRRICPTSGSTSA